MIATLTNGPTPRSTLEDMADELGPMRLFILAARASLTYRPRKKRRVAALSLNNHLRKDIGLEPLEAIHGLRRPTL